MNVLLNLIENVNTWGKLEKRIAALTSEQQRGNAFEEFCHAFFLLDPVFKFKKVYRQNEIPSQRRISHESGLAILNLEEASNA